MPFFDKKKLSIDIARMPSPNVETEEHFVQPLVLTETTPLIHQPISPLMSAIHTVTLPSTTEATSCVASVLNIVSYLKYPICVGAAVNGFTGNVGCVEILSNWATGNIGEDVGKIINGFRVPVGIIGLLTNAAIFLSAIESLPQNLKVCWNSVGFSRSRQWWENAWRGALLFAAAFIALFISIPSGALSYEYTLQCSLFIEWLGNFGVKILAYIVTPLNGALNTFMALNYGSAVKQRFTDLKEFLDKEYQSLQEEKGYSSWQASIMVAIPVVLSFGLVMASFPAIGSSMFNLFIDFLKKNPHADEKVAYWGSMIITFFSVLFGDGFFEFDALAPTAQQKSVKGSNIPVMKWIPIVGDITFTRNPFEEEARKKHPYLTKFVRLIGITGALSFIYFSWMAFTHLSAFNQVLRIICSVFGWIASYQGGLTPLYNKVVLPIHDALSYIIKAYLEKKHKTRQDLLEEQRLRLSLADMSPSGKMKESDIETDISAARYGAL